ncbi:hypothetical protein D3C74_398520 [compost metagenome]
MAWNGGVDLNEIVVYKIRNKTTGLFSRGGTNINNLWSKKGKSWSNIGHLKNHLIQLNCYNRKVESPYKDAEIIKVIEDYSNCAKFDVSVIEDEMARKREFDAKRTAEEFKKYHEQIERKQLENLKRKYESE